MRIALSISAFIVFIVSNAAFSFKWWIAQQVYMQDYTYGELWYQTGLLLGCMLLFLSARNGVNKWQLKLVFNWIIEIYLIAIWFTIFHNPYSINWDKMLFLQISGCGMLVFYAFCALFPFCRRFIL